MKAHLHACSDSACGHDPARIDYSRSADATCRRKFRETLDRNQIEAARDLGASTWRIHWRVVIPHAKPGIAVGCIMTFMLSAGSYSVPQVMTRGKSGDWFSQLIYRQFFESFNWNIGAAYSFSLLLVCIAFIFLMMTLFRVGIRDIAR